MREVLQPLQIRQSGVGDLSAAEIEVGELGQPLQVRQLGVANRRSSKIQALQPRKKPDACDDRIGNRPPAG